MIDSTSKPERTPPWAIPAKPQCPVDADRVRIRYENALRLVAAFWDRWPSEETRAALWLVLGGSGGRCPGTIECEAEAKFYTPH
jgi:hypothetical protein